MPIFMDRHDMAGATAENIAEAHRKDLEIQDKYGVKYMAGQRPTAWQSLLYATPKRRGLSVASARRPLRQGDKVGDRTQMRTA